MGYWEWQVRSPSPYDHSPYLSSSRRLYTLIGHRGEISNAVFNFSGSLIATASMDHTCKLWDSASGRIITTLRGHKDEVLDISFDTTGQRLATASADGTCSCMSHHMFTCDPPGTARVYDSATHNCLANMCGHKGEISKVIFCPHGNRLLTVSSDKTARLWDTVTGDCVQVRKATPPCM